MTCRRAEWLIQQSLDGALTSRERRELDVHLGGCAACRLAWKEYRGLTRLAMVWTQRPAQADDPGSEFAAQVRARIASSSSARVSPSGGHAALWPRPFAFAAALGILGVLSYLFGAVIFKTFAPLTGLLLPPRAVVEVPGRLLSDLRALPQDAFRAWTGLARGFSLPGVGVREALGAALLANFLFFLRAARSSRGPLAQ